MNHRYYSDFNTRFDLYAKRKPKGNLAPNQQRRSRKGAHSLGGTSAELRTKATYEDGRTILAHRRGILAWYDGHLSTAKIEGINNKIKVLKRVAYGFRDDEYFRLRLFALHDSHITRNVG